MKRFVLILAVLLPVVCRGQENFYADKGGIIWRHVFQNDADATTIETNLRAKGCFREILRYDGGITAELYGYRMDIEAAGHKRMSVPIYLANGEFSAFVNVQMKEGRYRVTVRRLRYHVDRLGDSDLSQVALDDNGNIDAKFSGQQSEVINYNLITLFSDLGETENDEW